MDQITTFYNKLKEHLGINKDETIFEKIGLKNDDTLIIKAKMENNEFDPKNVKIIKENIYDLNEIITQLNENVINNILKKIDIVDYNINKKKEKKFEDVKSINIFYEIINKIVLLLEYSMYYVKKIDETNNNLKNSFENFQIIKDDYIEHFCKLKLLDDKLKPLDDNDERYTKILELFTTINTFYNNIKTLLKENKNIFGNNDNLLICIFQLLKITITDLNELDDKLDKKIKENKLSEMP
jgi:hypothetical protein